MYQYTTFKRLFSQCAKMFIMNIAMTWRKMFLKFLKEKSPVDSKGFSGSSLRISTILSF